MPAIRLNIDVPQTAHFDYKTLERQLTNIAHILIMTPSVQPQQVEHGRCKYSDMELDEMLADCPMLREEDIPEVSDEDYREMVKSMQHKPIKGVEKWL